MDQQSLSDGMHVVALSGGHDSSALALRLAEIEPRPYTYVCTPTGDELPEMFAHWRSLGEMLGKRIVPVMASTGLRGMIREEKMLPNFRARWCTRRAKIEPYRKWLSAHTPCVSYVGLRADEEGRAGGAYSDIEGVQMRFPLREWGWGEAEVQNYLNTRGVIVPERTDCARCYHQRLGEWWRLWNDHRDIWDTAEEDEALIGATFRTPGRDTWPSALKDMRAEFERGRIPKRADEQDLFQGLRKIGECRVCTL